MRQALSDQAAVYMMAELCDDKDTADPVGASIFDHDSSRGLELDETEDHWIRDVAAGTWTRVIVVPRKAKFHPSEGEGGPDLGIPRRLRVVCDNWKAAGFDDALLGEQLWTGKCVFKESWDHMTDEAESDPVASVAHLLREVSAVTAKDSGDGIPLPNGLVFTDMEEYSLVDDLWGGSRRTPGDSGET